MWDKKKTIEIFDEKSRIADVIFSKNLDILDIIT